MIDLLRLDCDFILDTQHLWRRILANTVQMNLNAMVLKANHGRDAFNAFEHAGRECGQEKLRRIEGIRTASQIRIQDDFSPFAPGYAAVSVYSTPRYGVLQLFLSRHSSNSYLRIGPSSISSQ